MLLICLLFTIVRFGSSTLTEEVCYGAKYNLPASFTPPLYNKTITCTPKLGDSKIVVNNGQSLDPRFQVSQDEIEMADLTEQDNETVLSTEKGDSVKVNVKNCRSPVKKFYGSSIIWIIPDEAEYLEFSKYNVSDTPGHPIVLWNRTDPSYSRGNASSNDYEIKNITQQDSGYYRFRGSKHQLLKWEQIVVEEHVKNYTYVMGKMVYIEFPLVVIISQVRFTHVGAETHTVLENGGRVLITNQYLTIDDATFEDAGTYEFFDKEGNLILHVEIVIKEDEEPLHWFFIVALCAFGAGFMGLGGHFCWKKYKNKRKSSDTSEEVTPAVIFQALKDNSNRDPTTL
ncbi:hypothetical protein NL108_014044 [Boleophthalmus pectinirostris]|uniref:uncharacterized protein LOC129407595 n=1 Tax=Boleophthalmus pectinirostris TaxID=150288 RepID=UPI0024326DFB|nr:uncharacterized protein LOC129407595 [Boleophthalmus pectinirostris]KAJ0039434.1 hypothetical protein NL108_014044 [Boleophthalmus pectinirostris]